MIVGIVGLGLIGGSMAKSIKNRTAHTVYGADLNAETMTMARMCGAIDAPLTAENLPECDLVLVAIRPGAAVEWVRQNAACISKSAILVDLCGVKRTVVEAITPIAAEHGFAYIGGHPMAGRERGGFTAATDDLYVGASMILTPDARTDMQLLETLKAFFLDIGFAGLTFSTPAEHDRIIAFTSQLAHITSSAYVKSPEAQKRRGFSAGSFQDMTRVARLDEDMWTELFLDDADYLTSELEVLVGHLTEYLDALKARDSARLRALLKEGRELKATPAETEAEPAFYHTLYIKEFFPCPTPFKPSPSALPRATPFPSDRGCWKAAESSCGRYWAPAGRQSLPTAPWPPSMPPLSPPVSAPPDFPSVLISSPQARLTRISPPSRRSWSSWPRSI